MEKQTGETAIRLWDEYLTRRPRLAKQNEEKYVKLDIV
jgi:hypothetical protein